MPSVSSTLRKPWFSKHTPSSVPITTLNHRLIWYKDLPIKSPIDSDIFSTEMTQQSLQICCKWLLWTLEGCPTKVRIDCRHQRPTSHTFAQIQKNIRFILTFRDLAECHRSSETYKAGYLSLEVVPNNFLQLR